jgi:hypothetical protein
MKVHGSWQRWSVVTVAMLASLWLGQAWARTSIVKELGATGVDENARGRTRLVLTTTSAGRFDVTVKGLPGDATFEMLVDGVKVGTLVTSTGGRGRLRFRTEPRERDHLLGFDPRGTTIVVRDDHGNDVLSGSIPDDDSQPGAGACCDPRAEDDGTVECESRTPEACAARGGTFLASASCLPNPCAGAPPAPGDVVCCVPDNGDRAECEDRTEAECLAQGGMVVEAGSCVPNPCAPTPAPDDIQCCLPDNSGVECEDRTPEECAAQGGVDMGPGSCDPNPCG